jgi:hypothetical protein
VQNNQLLSEIAEILFHELTLYIYLNSRPNDEVFKPRLQKQERPWRNKTKTINAPRRRHINTDDEPR